MLKKFLMKKMVQSQIKNLPKDQQEKILRAVETNPELFTKIAKEVQEKVKGGRDKQGASMEVMFKYQNELKKAME